MDAKITWKAQIQFAGTPEEFDALSAALEKFNIRVVPDAIWPKPPWPGLIPMPASELLAPRLVDALVSKASLRTRLEFLKGIRGGIREPHLHLVDEVVFLDRTAFKSYVSGVAQALAERRADASEDYIGVMAGLEALAAIPIQIP